MTWLRTGRSVTSQGAPRTGGAPMDVRPSTKMTLTNRPPTSIPRVSLLGLVAMDMIVSAYLATTWRPDYFCPCQNKRGIRRWGLCVLKEEPSGDWGHLKQSLLAGPQVVYSDDLPLPTPSPPASTATTVSLWPLHLIMGPLSREDLQSGAPASCLHQLQEGKAIASEGRLPAWRWGCQSWAPPPPGFERTKRRRGW